MFLRTVMIILLCAVFTVSCTGTDSNRDTVLSDVDGRQSGCDDDENTGDDGDTSPVQHDADSPLSVDDISRPVDSDYVYDIDVYDEDFGDEDEEKTDTDPSRRYITVPSDGGVFRLFSETVILSFPAGWTEQSSVLCGVRENETAVSYEFTAEVPRFYRQVRIAVSGSSEQRDDSDSYLLTRSVGEDTLRMNGSEFSSDGFSALISRPGVFAVVPIVRATCPSGMLEVKTERVYYHEELVPVDTCMDTYEASQAAVGSLGNVDQSGSWAVGCERAGSCGDGSTTSLVNSTADVLPLTDVSWYQATVLCQNTGKVLCPELIWRVGCEGEYDPLDPYDKPCNYGVTGPGCSDLGWEQCFLRENKEMIEDEYAQAEQVCNIEYDHCKKSPADCNTDRINCLDAAESAYNEHFQTAHYSTCRSITGAWDMVGNVREFILFEDETDTVVSGVMRGGSYVQSIGSADLTCRPVSDDGACIQPSTTLSSVGFRCCFQ